VVIEERLFGLEASVIALCDGREAVALPPARDHKRLLDGDHGPNTGGMGAYSPLPDLAATDAAAIASSFHRPILAELARRGTPFQGALYAGLILTRDGPVLLECNARFGDPETQVLLPRLAVDLGPLLLAAAEGDLAGTAALLGVEGPLLPVFPEAAVAIVLASAGYPEAPRKGDPIAGLAFAEEAGALVFHAGTAPLPDGRFATAGGRVLTVVGRGPDLAAARRQAEAAADRIGFAGMQRRSDIAARIPAASRDPSGAQAAAVPVSRSTFELGAGR
jgi:phosphoribosylamine--glycine ligase